MKRKTHEEYIKELKIKNPNVQVVGEYINANTKIMHKCLIHDKCWETTPSRALKGVGCEKCHKEKIFQSLTRTHEEYIQQLKEVNPNIIPLEKFITINDPILHHCTKHDITWKVIPDNVLRGHGCWECGKEKIGNKNKKPYEQYKTELNEKFPTIECIGKYKNSTTPVLHKCIDCTYEWSSTPTNILNGVGCPRCTHHLKRDEEYYIKELEEINPQIELVGEFTNMSTHTLHRCKIHDYCWSVIPSSIIIGTGCPLCAREKSAIARLKKPEDFKKELKAISPEIICIGKYYNATTKVLVHCLKCNHTWETLPSCLLTGHKCPSCNKSKGETIIANWLKENNINFIQQKKFEDCKDKRSLPFDFYLPDNIACVEYDGLQHFKSINWFGGEERLEYIKKHDQIKTQYCEDNNIKLLRISYNDNIEEKLKQFIYLT